MTTTEGRLTESEPVGEPSGDGHALTAAAESRVRRHLDAVWRSEATVRAALRGAPGESRYALDDYAGQVDYRLRMIETELDLAGAILAAEVAESPGAFAAAVDAETDVWELYVERLQGRAATRSGSARTEAEEAVRVLRHLLTALTHRLGEFRSAPADEWPESSAAVRAASDALERAVDELSDRFD